MDRMREVTVRKEQISSYLDDEVDQHDLRSFLKDLEYPASRDDIIACGRVNLAPMRVIGFLEKIPTRRYKDLLDIEHELSVMSSGGMEIEQEDRASLEFRIPSTQTEFELGKPTAALSGPSGNSIDGDIEDKGLTQFKAISELEVPDLSLYLKFMEALKYPLDKSTILESVKKRFGSVPERLERIPDRRYTCYGDLETFL